MCGFSGFVQYSENKFDKAKRLRILKSMGAAIAHRGPDDEQFYDDGVLSLVYRRLSIVDMAGGRQPIFSEDASSLLVCNGEIYNHAELRNTLCGRHQFKTGSDSEVLLHGYEDWQEGVLQRTRGMFAMAIWDCRQQHLFLARDRLGIKPLYVCHLPNGILFGSELKALLVHPDCPREMDWRNLSGNPIAHAITPTYVKGIEHLPGGCYLRAQAGRKAHVHTYWHLSQHFNTAPFGQDANRYVAEFDDLLEAAVAEHLQGEATVGLHLSGGVDSSLVAAIAAPMQPAMPSYTIVERSNFLAGDATAAADVADTLGLNWTPILFDYRTLLSDTGFSLKTLEQASWMMDSPLFDIEWIFKRQLNQVIRNNHPDLKVLLLGQGADEFSGGYSTRIDAPYRHWNHYLRDEVRHHLSMATADIPMRDGHHSVFLGKRKIPPGINTYQELMLLMPRQLQNHNLWHEDRTSSWLGMEARVPFLDHRIVEFFASVPVGLHKKLFWNKTIIRRALQKRLPKYNIERPKIGFCWTDDSRSLDLIIQSMAGQAINEFRERYMEDKNFPFDLTETNRLIDLVQTRQPGFKDAGVQLLGQMSASIFRFNVNHAASVLATAPVERSVSGLEKIESTRWPAIEQHFARQPVIPFDWHPEHCPKIPADCKLQLENAASGQTTCRLLQGHTVHAELTLPPDALWIRALVIGLNDPSKCDFTLLDWTNDLGVSQAQITDVLDMMLQCGVVTTPLHGESKTRVARFLLDLKSRFFYLQRKSRTYRNAPLHQWMHWLDRRKQVLESKLEP